MNPGVSSAVRAHDLRAPPCMPLRPPISTPHERVTFIACRPDAREHELATQRAIARRLAALMGCRFEEVRAERGASIKSAGYAVPNETITSIDAALALGIEGETDLFGGVVPYPFVATKTITHPLVAGNAVAPVGWRPEFCERVRDVVLPGFSAFSAADARTGGAVLLRDGDIRVKLASGIGGSGQSVAHDASELQAQLTALDPTELGKGGLVIERNLADVKTYSVGIVRVGSMLMSYYGTQTTTRSRHGDDVYGGSSITVARGGFDALARLPLDEPARRAIEQARVYHFAALECFGGMFASRCNYDVAQGHDAAGRAYSGVLEQSWRIGGASGAEVAALEALCNDPSMQVVRASTVEVHRPYVAVPNGATVYFSGIDDQLGPITKYARIHEDDFSRTEN